MAEEIIFRVGVDTGNSESKVDGVTTSLEETDKAAKDLNKSTTNLSATFDEVYGDLKPLSARMGELEDRMYELALAGKQNTQEFIDLQTEAANFRQTIIKVDQSVDNLAMRGKNLQTALQLGETVVAGYGAIQGITALVGSESEELTETLVKLQGVQSLLAATEQIRLAVEHNSLLSIKANTLAQQAYTLVVGQSTGAMKAFRIALAATGIGALVAIIAALIINWDDWTGSISKSAIAVEGLTDTLDEYKQGATEAAEQTSKVKTAFELSREGVISKEEALQTYNDTLGDSFGKANDLNEAERLFTEKTDAYIKAAALRAQANALLSKAAEEQANALTAQMEDQTSFLDNAASAFDLYAGNYDKAVDRTIASQKRGVKQAKSDATERASIFTDEAERLLKEAEITENANGIKSESEKKLAEERQKIADEAQKKREAAAQKEREEAAARAEELKRLQREITDASIASIQDRETRERMALAEKHRREMEDLRAQYGERQELIMALEERQAIEQRNFDRLQDELSQQAIEEAKLKREEENVKREQEASTLSARLLEIAQKSAADQKAVDDALFASKAALASNVANVIGQLAGLAREGTATQKALALTEIAINTAVGFVNGLRIAQQSAAATGPGAAFVFPIFYAQQIGAVLAAAKQAKSILGSGASVSAPSIPSGSGSSATSASVPQGSLGDNGTTNTSSLQEPEKPLVVLPVSSLKKVMSQDLIAESIATFGG